MRLKIKWNDDRVRAATTALLLISRDRLSRGDVKNLISASLAEYRADVEGFKNRKAASPEVSDLGTLSKPQAIASYKNLLLAVDDLLKKTTAAKRQFNSLTDLDNYLVSALRNVC